MSFDISEEELFDSIYLKDIESISQMEGELKKYLQDFTLLKGAWNVDHPFP